MIFTVVTPEVRRRDWVWEAKPEKAGTAREKVPASATSVTPSASAQSAQAQDKRPAARAAVLDSGEQSENIRIVPGGDN